MAAGLVIIPIIDGGGTTRQMSFWSSDGTVNGNLSPVPFTQDGNDIALGATTDAAVTSAGMAGSVIALLKGAITYQTAISAAQISGAQKTQLVDQSGNIIHATSNALNVNIAGGSVIVDFGSPTGSAVPSDAGYFGVNVGGTLRGLTAVNPSGSIYAAQFDLASIAGTTTLKGNGVSANSLRVTLASDSTGIVALTTGAAVIGSLVANQSVNTAQINGVAPTMGNGISGTGVQRVTIASDSTGQIALAAGAALIGKVSIDQTTPGTTNGVQVNAALPAGSNIIGNFRIDQTTPGTTNGVQVNAALPAGANIIGALVANQSINLVQVAGASVSTGNGTAAGSIRVALPTDGTGVVGLIAGTALIGKVGIDQTTPGTTNAVVATASTAGGVSTAAFLGGTGTALVTTAAAIKASAGNLYGLNIYNPNASIAYLQIFDLAVGSITLGTTVPKMSIPIPPNGFFDVEYEDEAKITFATAISIAATTAATNITTVGTGLTVNALYK